MQSLKLVMCAELKGFHMCRSQGGDVCTITKWCCMQSHKVRRLDMAEVAKLGRDNEQAASGQTIKQEDIKQENVKEEDVQMEDVKQEEVKQEGVKLEDIKQEGVSQEPGPSGKSSKSATGPTGSSCHAMLCADGAWHYGMWHAAWHSALQSLTINMHLPLTDPVIQVSIKDLLSTDAEA